MNTDFLFARPSFIEGMARIVDFGNTLNHYNDSPTPQDADRVALSMDWGMVGEDMYQAISNFETEEAEKLSSIPNS